jgi:threonylcarbamoyladenosine tRNA methylthiotransferase MtaB
VVPVSVRQERNKILRLISEKKKRAFYESQINLHRPVLWEAQEEEGIMSGFTDNYVRVKTSFRSDLINTTCTVALVSIDSDCIARCLQQELVS